VRQEEALALLGKLAEKHDVELPEDIVFVAHPDLLCQGGCACMIHDDLGRSAIVLPRDPAPIDVAHEFEHYLGHVKKASWLHDEGEVERRAKKDLEELGIHFRDLHSSQEVKKICVEHARYLTSDILYALYHAGRGIWDYPRDLIKGRIRVEIEDLKEDGCIRDETYREILGHLEHALKATEYKDLDELHRELDLVLDRTFVDLLR